MIKEYRFPEIFGLVFDDDWTPSGGTPSGGGGSSSSKVRVIEMVARVIRGELTEEAAIDQIASRNGVSKTEATAQYTREKKDATLVKGGWSKNMRDELAALEAAAAVPTPTAPAIPAPSNPPVGGGPGGPAMASLAGPDIRFGGQSVPYGLSDLGTPTGTFTQTPQSFQDIAAGQRGPIGSAAGAASGARPSSQTASGGTTSAGSPSATAGGGGQKQRDIVYGQLPDGTMGWKQDTGRRDREGRVISVPVSAPAFPGQNFSPVPTRGNLAWQQGGDGMYSLHQWSSDDQRWVPTGQTSPTPQTIPATEQSRALAGMGAHKLTPAQARNLGLPAGTLVDKQGRPVSPYGGELARPVEGFDTTQVGSGLTNLYRTGVDEAGRRVTPQLPASMFGYGRNIEAGMEGYGIPLDQQDRPGVGYAGSLAGGVSSFYGPEGGIGADTRAILAAYGYRVTGDPSRDTSLLVDLLDQQAQLEGMGMSPADAHAAVANANPEEMSTSARTNAALDAMGLQVYGYNMPVARAGRGSATTVRGGEVIEAATGWNGVVDQPTVFLAGEGGQPEQVNIDPINTGGLTRTPPPPNATDPFGQKSSGSAVYPLDSGLVRTPPPSNATDPFGQASSGVARYPTTIDPGAPGGNPGGYLTGGTTYTNDNRETGGLPMSYWDILQRYNQATGQNLRWLPDDWQTVIAASPGGGILTPEQLAAANAYLGGAQQGAIANSQRDIEELAKQRAAEIAHRQAIDAYGLQAAGREREASKLDYRFGRAGLPAPVRANVIEGTNTGGLPINVGASQRPTSLYFDPTAIDVAEGADISGLPEGIRARYQQFPYQIEGGQLVPTNPYEYNMFMLRQLLGGAGAAATLGGGGVGGGGSADKATGYDALKELYGGYPMITTVGGNRDEAYQRSLNILFGLAHNRSSLGPGDWVSRSPDKRLTPPSMVDAQTLANLATISSGGGSRGMMYQPTPLGGGY